MPPKVSVVMSVYNGSCYLREAVESILNQTFTDFEFIIIDDCSTEPQVGEILSQYEQQDQRIKLLQNETNLGLTKSLNKGLAKAQGEYIARMDADDISLPQRLAEQVAYMESNPEIVMIGTGVSYINESGESVGSYVPSDNKALLNWQFLFRNPLRHSTIMWRRKFVSQEVGDYDVSLNCSQDYDLWVRIKRKSPIRVLASVLVLMRRHELSVGSQKMKLQEMNGTEVTYKQLHDFLGFNNLSLDIVADLRIIPWRKNQYQKDRLLYFFSPNRLRNSYLNYIKIWSNYVKMENIKAGDNGRSFLKKELEQDTLPLIRICQQRKWLITSLFILALNFYYNNSLFWLILKQSFNYILIRVKGKIKSILYGSNKGQITNQ